MSVERATVMTGLSNLARKESDLLRLQCMNPARQSSTWASSKGQQLLDQQVRIVIESVDVHNRD